ncbi:hypothetical protein JMJ56_09220 [Belnapia sp. T18]|uniref:Uncharacterized protein n=1 Tax=Belnapia arida TaxID=2804533 RepID=A0ABS1U0I1_9PROT|nr:hypothetical protein [Belnapia arida]MBL6078184.1 hypothetical protein [Belnapia arida]
MKALPHVGQRHGETVCCAGVTMDGQWRRQYPIHFRRLRDNQFSRWQWIEYDWIAPGPEDQRRESRRVQEETIEVGEVMPERERAQFLEPIITGSTKEAAAKGMSLTLVRPISVRFRWKAKTEKQIAEERAAYEDAARQKSFLDPDLTALNPCPYAFHFDWTDAEGKTHKATCDDWETAATYYRRERTMGAKAALADLEKTFGAEYPARGMAFAMGTHSRRAEQWLLVGVLRLDRVSQLSLF